MKFLKMFIFFERLSNHIIISCSILMPEKHINRKKRDLSAEDEWAHITGAGGKIDAADAMEVQDRAITFKNEFGERATNYEAYEEEKNSVKDHVGNTAQYLKFINESIKAKRDRLNKIYESQKKFQDDIDALRGPESKSKSELDMIRYKDIKSQDINQAVKHLENERESIRKKMEHFASMVSHAQIELIEKDKQIAELKAESEILARREDNRKSQEQEVDPVDIIKNKLKELGVGNNPDEIKKVLDSLLNQGKSE